MNDSRCPFHATSYLDAFGEPPYLSRLPRLEEDFSSRNAAELFLREHGGGTLEHHDGKGWKLIASILPEGEGGCAFVA
jgi:hypothetical protein